MPPFLAVGVHGCSHLGGIVPVPAPPPVQGVCACRTPMPDMSGGHRAPRGSVPRCNVTQGHQPCIGTHLFSFCDCRTTTTQCSSSDASSPGAPAAPCLCTWTTTSPSSSPAAPCSCPPAMAPLPTTGQAPNHAKAAQTLRVSTPGASTQATTRSDPP